MAAITTNPNVNTQNYGTYGNTEAGTVGKTDQTAGAGSIAGAKNAPDVVVTNMTSLMASLAGVMPKMSGDQVDVLIAVVQTKMKETTDKTERGKIEADQLSKHNALQGKEKKLEEASKAQADAADKMKHASVWDKVKLAFSYIGAILTMVAGAIMIATGVGAVAGALLIGAGALMLCLAIDQTIETAQQDQGKPALGMFGLAAKADYERRHPGCSQDDAVKYATKAQMGVQIALMGVAMLMSLPSMIGGVAGMVSSVTSMAMKVADAGIEIADISVEVGTEGASMATEITEEAGETASQSLSLGQRIINVADKIEEQFATAEDTSKAMVNLKKTTEVASDVTQVGDGVSTVGSSATHYEASKSSAEAKTNQADAKEYQGLQAFLDDQIDAAIARLKTSGDRFNAVLDSLTDAVKDRGDTMSHMRLRA